jgi:hypothetical protein
MESLGKFENWNLESPRLRIKDDNIPLLLSVWMNLFFP